MKTVQNLVETMQIIQLLEPGIYFDIPAAYYHSLPYVSNSYLGKLDYCPASAKIPTKVTPEMVFGRATHTFIMEPHLFKREFYTLDCLAPASTAIGKRERALAMLDNKDKELIPVEGKNSLETLVGMNTAVLQHPSARRYLHNCYYEVTLIWDHVLPSGSVIRMKARVDAIPKTAFGILADLKSTDDSSEVGFQRSIIKYGYHRQAPIYLDAINTLADYYFERGLDFPFPTAFDTFVFVCVEKNPPYRTECHDLTPDFLEYGRSDYHRLLEIERSCREAKGGPRYPAYRNAGVSTIDMPAYLRPRT